MRANRFVRLLLSTAATVLAAAWLYSAPRAQQAQAAVEIDTDDIGGVVTGPKVLKRASG